MTAAHAHQALDALGDPTRRRVLELVRGEPAAVREIAAQLPVSRPAVSKHLKVLADAGLVTHVRAGRRSLYRVDTRGLEAVRSYVDGFWTDVLQAFADHVGADRIGADRIGADRIGADRIGADHVGADHDPADHDPADNDQQEQP